MYEIYKIKFGDNLNTITKMYNTNIEELTKLNGIIDLNNLKEDMQIIVPSNTKNPYKYYTVKKNDTITSIAKENNIDKNLLININGLEENDYIYPNQTLILPKEGIKLYLTKSDDTIKSISKKLNIPDHQLLKDNDSIYLRENQIIVY